MSRRTVSDEFDDLRCHRTRFLDPAQSYQHLKEEIGDALESVPGIGGTLRRAAKSFKDAIAAAGGLTEEADLSTVNLARRLRDGELIVLLPLLGADRV